MPNPTVEELHQVAATRTERRLCDRVDSGTHGCFSVRIPKMQPDRAGKTHRLSPTDSAEANFWTIGTRWSERSTDAVRLDAASSGRDARSGYLARVSNLVRGAAHEGSDYGTGHAAPFDAQSWTSCKNCCSGVGTAIRLSPGCQAHSTRGVCMCSTIWSIVRPPLRLGSLNSWQSCWSLRASHIIGISGDGSCQPGAPGGACNPAVFCS